MFEQIQAAATTIATYTTPTRFNSRHCMLVARHLMSDAPSSLNELQKRALDLVLSRATAVDEVRKERACTSSSPTRRPPRPRGGWRSSRSWWGERLGTPTQNSRFWKKAAVARPKSRTNCDTVDGRFQGC